MSVANISTTLPGVASAAQPARAIDPVEWWPRKRERDGVGTADASTSEKTAQTNGGAADRFDPSPRAALAGSGSGKTSQASKEDKAKAFERELAAIQQAAAQTRYGVGGQGSSASLQHDFESLLMAVGSGNLTAAQQALTRLQGASMESGTATTVSNTKSPAPLPHSKSSS